MTFYTYKKDTKEEDTYHGEHDDIGYDSLYIPHIEGQLATIQEVKRVFSEKNIGDVTTVTFTERVVPSTYKGKNKKKAYSATVYLKWRENTLVNNLRQAIFARDQNYSKLHLDAQHHWVIHLNTVPPSDTLYVERYYIADTKNTAVDMALRVLDDTEEDLALYALEDTARSVVMQLL